VGGGLSGLAAAWFYRQSKGVDAKILILENHDDFGGHAKRNEYNYNGQNILVNGGTLNLEQPSNYSPVAMGLLRALGIDTEAYHEKTKEMLLHHQNLGMGISTYFDEDTFGGEGQVTRDRMSIENWEDFFDKAPLLDVAKRDLKRIHTEDIVAPDLQDLSDTEKKQKLAGITYSDYVVNYLGLDSSILPFFIPILHFAYYMGPEQVPALYCWEMGIFPGFKHLKLEPSTQIGPLHHIGGPQRGREFDSHEGKIHFPDGNATVARMIVRHLLPEAIPGKTLEDLFTAKVNYGLLDRANNNTHIRLNSIVTKVAHNGDPEAAKDVDISYVNDEKAYRVKAKNVVLACWHNVIPYICDDFSDEQKEAQRYGIKAPRVYTNVLLKNGKAFEKLGAHMIFSPGLYHSTTNLHYPLEVGDYVGPKGMDEPIVVKMHRAPCAPGQDRRTQLRLGRYDLLGTPFEVFERNIREQLNRMLGPFGFDAARDIVAITVNRWPHGNAYAYDPISEPYHWAMYATDDRPCVVARQQLGRISIANSDAGASPFTDVAIDQAHRAVSEVLADQQLMG